MISVVVPIYNVAEFLPQCIQSVCSQTYKDLEIILVDDGSTDGSSLICDEYAGKDERICVIHKENGGLVSARKAGLKVAQGEYISCIDSDDWVEPDMLQKLMELETDADVICFAGYEECEGYRGIKRNTVEEGLYHTREQLADLYGKMLMNKEFFVHGISTSIWNKLFKRSVLEPCQMNVPDIVSYGEDTACVYPCLLAAHSVYITNFPLYHYRMRQGSIVRGASVSSENFRQLYKTLNNFFSMNEQRANLHQQLKFYMWQALLLKGYDRIGNDMILFPFENVQAGMRVGIYGAGLFGQVIENYCRESEQVSVTGWFDKRSDLYVRQGMAVSACCNITNTEFDMLVIAILDTAIAQQVKADYIKKGISEDKIAIINKAALEKIPLPKWLME